MSACLEFPSSLRPMDAADLDQVMQIEPTLYSHPWTRGNFDDSLRVGYACWVAQCGTVLAGYGVLMMGAGEAHLLNLSVAAAWQGRGLGSALLEKFVGIARAGNAAQMFLEVRPSNAGARRLYTAFGFREMTIRRGYYPAGRGREDAILMGLSL